MQIRRRATRRIHRTAIFLLTLSHGLTAAAGGAEVVEGTRAVVAEVGGAVTIRSPGRAGTILPARPLLVLNSGQEISLPNGGRVQLICSNDRLVRLRGKQRRWVNVNLCGQGSRLPPGTYDLVAPKAGRVLRRDESSVIASATRGLEHAAGQIPHLLSPRNTAVLDSQPSIVWTPATEASQYEIRFEGPVRFNLRIDARKVDCSLRWAGLQACSIPYPKDRPHLPVDRNQSIRIGSVEAGSIRVRKGYRVEVRLLSPAEADRVRTLLEHIGELPLTESMRSLASARVLASAGLFSDAIKACAKAQSLADSPEWRIAYGDVLRMVGLHGLAREHYEYALKIAPSTASEAAVLFELGRLEYRAKRYGKAVGFFESSLRLTQSLELPEESSAAKSWLLKSRRRLMERSTGR